VDPLFWFPINPETVWRSPPSWKSILLQLLVMLLRQLRPYAAVPTSMVLSIAWRLSGSCDSCPSLRFEQLDQIIEHKPLITNVISNEIVNQLLSA
jgi:hypothetical protein